MKQLFTILTLLLCLSISRVWAQTDAGVISIVPLTADCGSFSTGLTIQITYQNSGTTPITNTPLGFSIPGVTPVSEIATGTVASSGVASYTFTTTLVLPQPNTLYTVKVWTAQPGDNNALNDTFTTPVFSPPKVDLPYNEDFESFTPGDPAAPFGVPGVISPVWIRSATVNSNFNGQGWFVTNAPTPSASTGPNFDHSPNGDTYMFIETNGGTNGTSHTLKSPCIDLTGSVVPRLSFWYHMFGNNINTLQVKVLVGGISTTVWTLTGQQQSSSGSPWLEGIVDLSPYAGDVIELEFVGIRGNGQRGDIAIDDISVYDPDPTDAGLVGLASPAPIGCNGPNEEILITLQNFGSQALDLTTNPVTINLDITGPTNASYNATVNTGTIPLLGSRDISLTTTANLALPGVYSLIAYTTVVGDSSTFNDTLRADVVTLPTLIGPFREDFETFPTGGPGVFFNGWTSLSDNVQGWYINAGGTPTANTGPAGNNTAGGTRYAYSEQTNFPLLTQGDRHDLFTPCIDVSLMANPKLSFHYHMFGAQTGALEVYILNGDTTQLVFTQVGQNQIASGDPWDSTVVDLAPFRNDLFQVLFRSIRGTGDRGDIGIDDLNIFEPAPVDVQAAALIDPVPQCEFTSTETVTAAIVNFGTDTISNIVAQFSVDGGPFSPFENVIGIVPPGDTVFHTFASTANLSGPGNHSITIVATQLVPPDINSSNDTLTVNLFNFRSEVSTFPYFEDFENGKGDWESVGPLDPWAFGDPNKPTITNASSGDSCWITGLTGLYINNADGFVVGPCFNFSSLNTPVIRLDVFWESEPSWDGAVLQYSTDNGQSWFNVGSFGDPNNWYTDNSIDALPGGSLEGWAGRNASGSGRWLTAEHDLVGLGGLSSVLLRVAFASDGFVNDEGFAFDDIEIFEKPPFDAQAERIVEPNSGCGLSDSTKIIFEFSNQGTATIANMDVSYQVNNGPVVTESISPNLPFQILSTYAFNATADLSIPGQYNIKAWVTRPGDTLNTNDTAEVIVTSIPLVNTFPYDEDFDSGPAGWTSGGNNSTWALGYPQKTVIQGAASDSNAWVNGGLTGLYVNNEQSFVISPCFDFTSLSAPIVRMAIWYESENGWDGAVLQSSIDNGLTWQRVGNVGNPVNWYNDATINGSPGGQPQGWSGRNGSGSGGWIIAQRDLTGLAGLADVRLRVAFGSDGSLTDDGFAFDDFQIFDRATNDLEGIAFVDIDPSFCDNDSTPLRIRIANSGLAVQANTPIRVEIEGPGGTVVNGSIPGVLNPGDTVLVDLGNFASFLPGTYSLKGYAILPGDTLFFNDTAYAEFDIIQTPNDPVMISDSICAANGSVFNLAAITTAQNVQWFDAPAGGNLINQGNTYTTPFLTSSQTYYAQASNSTLFNVGPPNTSFGNGSFVNFTAGLDFTVFQTINLESVRVFPSTSGNLTIVIRNLTTGQNLTGTPINVPVVAGNPNGFVVPLNITIPPGNWEILRDNVTTANLFRHFNGATYPYSIPNVVNIFQASNNSTAFYYFFYDWQISTAGCASNRVPVDAVLLPPANVALGRDGIQCVGFNLDASADPSITNWQWFANGVPNPADTLSMYSVDSSGVYEVFVQNAAGCTDRDTIVLQIIPRPEINAGTDTAGCDEIILTTDSIPGATYFWFGPNAGTQNPTRTRYNATASGNYLLTINAGGCTNTDTVNVNILPAPVVNLGRDKATCDTIMLDAGPGGFTYLWSNGDTTQTTMVPPPATGTVSSYGVTVTNALGCAGGDSIDLRLGNPPLVNLGPDKTACDRVTLFSGVGSVDYLWNTGAVTQAITVNQSGTYSVKVTDRDGCTDEDSVNVSLDFTPTAGGSYMLGPGSYLVNFTNNSTPANATYVWDFGDGSPTDTATNPTHTYGFPASGYLVTLIATNNCGADTTTFLVSGVSNDLNALEQQVSVRPNPTTDWVNLEISELHAEELTIELTDLRGKRIHFSQTPNVHGQYNQRLDLRQYAEGVYILRINDGEREVRRRIVRK